MASMYSGVPKTTWRNSGSAIMRMADSSIHQGGVEHFVGVLLVGEDVLFLAAPYRIPVADGLLGGVAAVAGVADDAAQQAGVGGGDAVVAVEVQLGKAGDIDAGGLRRRQAGQAGAGSGHECLRG